GTREGQITLRRGRRGLLALARAMEEILFMDGSVFPSDVVAGWFLLALEGSGDETLASLLLEVGGSIGLSSAAVLIIVFIIGNVAEAAAADALGAVVKGVIDAVNKSDVQSRT